jgi:hypothetical protein
MGESSDAHSGANQPRVNGVVLTHGQPTGRAGILKIDMLNCFNDELDKKWMM